MELRTTRELRRAAQLEKTGTAKKADGSAPAKAQAAPKGERADKLTVSRQALSFLEEQNRKMWDLSQEREQRRQDQMDSSLSALEGKKSQLDSMAKKLRVQSKCQKIAASIMKGNRVPPEDLIYLMNNDPEGYKLAMAMRRQNPHPEDEKSVLDEEDKNGGSARSAEAGGDAPAPTVEAAAPSEGGGDGAPAME